MEKTKLQTFSKEQLENKRRSLIIFMAVLIFVIVYICYQLVRDYSKTEGLDWSLIGITICTVIGAITIYPELNRIQKELSSRS